MPAEQVEETPKVPVKTDFVPEENFSWNLDLESINKGKKKKKKVDIHVPNVIKQDPAKAVIKENIKLKLAENLEF